MIFLVPYGMGNFGYMLNIFKRIGIPSCSESDPLTLCHPSKPARSLE